MTRIAYLDCVGGLAGDMVLAGLLDAGAELDRLRDVPAELGLDDVTVDVGRVERHGIGALRVEVRAPDKVDQRPWSAVDELVRGSALPDEIKAQSLHVLARLAGAEAKVHAVPLEDVHLHELGAVDTLVDVCGAVTLLADLGVHEVLCSPLPFARGLTRAAHGTLPLPAPVTLELLVGAPLVGAETEGELVTPTGAAIASTLAAGWGPPPLLELERVGYGAGTADFRDRPNVVRVLLGSRVAASTASDVVVVETNLDDLSPELVPDAVERCFTAGALDVWTVPAQMKKGRPGFILSALARPAHERAVTSAILEETSALGVRVSRLHRHELEREERVVRVEGGTVRVKLGRLDGRVVNVAPEHDDCAAVARRAGRSVKSVWAAALAAAQEE
jgi:uncharacterized protein (TIGR00299 family) protein